MRKSTMLSKLLVTCGKAECESSGLSLLRQRFAQVFPAEKFAHWDGIVEGPAARDYMESLRLPPQMTAQLAI